MTRLLLVDPDAAFRIRVIRALSAHFDLSIPAPGDDPLRVARNERPDLALLASGGAARPHAIRLARVLKTDIRAVPSIGLYVRPGEEGPSAAAFASAGGDGFLAQAVTPEDLLAFALALSRGERPLPNPWPTPAAGPVRRLLSRVMRGR